MKLKYTTIIILVLFSLTLISPMVSAEKITISNTGEKGISIYFPDIENLKQNEDVTFRIQAHNKSDGLVFDNTTADCTIFLTYKNGSNYYFSPMDYDGNNFLKKIDGGNFSKIGEYGYGFYCNASNVGGFVSIPLTITPTGRDKISEGQGMIIIGSLFVVLIISSLFFFLGLHFNQTPFKVIAFGGAGIMIMIAVLYSTLTLQQHLGAFSSFIESYSTLWMITKSLVLIGVIASLIYGLIKAFQMWQYKRGLID